MQKRKIDTTTYQSLSILSGASIKEVGQPQLPFITKLIAVPDCQNVLISVTFSNATILTNYHIIPSPKHKIRRNSNEEEIVEEEFVEDKHVYSSNADFPKKDAEILETGYLRGQKVVRIAVYPIKANPADRIIKAYKDFDVTVSFANPSSDVNREVGIFRNVLHNAALNYNLSGMSPSSRTVNNTTTSGMNPLPKIMVSPMTKSVSTQNVSTGSVTWITNLSQLVGPNAIPIDYLIITHSSLFMNTALQTLAYYRNSHNGFDVGIVKVDGEGSIYDKYPASPLTPYISIRNFLSDVYNNGKSNHMGDGHLGYLLLVGDALMEDNTSFMVPSSDEYTDRIDPDNPNEICDKASDYYYACLTQDSPGHYDDVQDIMYGRLSVNNETKLSACVNKIQVYESNSNNNWNQSTCSVSYTPEFFHGSVVDADVTYGARIPAWTPSSAAQYYAYRKYDTQQSTVATIPPFTSICGVSLPKAQYDANTTPCGSDTIRNWLWPILNSGVHTFFYGGHGGKDALGTIDEGSRLFNTGTDPYYSFYQNLHNNFYSFMILNACNCGYFDNADPINGQSSRDCIAEQLLYYANGGAIGVLASSRYSLLTSADDVAWNIAIEQSRQYVEDIMGEAVMGAKLIGYYLPFKRQYNLFGDPALNLWPMGRTIANQNILWLGNVQISEPITISSGSTLTIGQEYDLGPYNAATTVRFTNNGSLIIDGGNVNAYGNIMPLTFINSNIILKGNNNLFNSCVFNGGNYTNVYINGGSGNTFTGCTFKNAQFGIKMDWCSGNTISNCVFDSNSCGVCLWGASASMDHNTISNNSFSGICLYNSQVHSFTNNAVENNACLGVYVGSSSVLDMGSGSSSFGDWNSTTPTSTSGKNKINNNALSNNSYGVYLDDGGQLYVGMLYGNSLLDGFNGITSNNGKLIYNAAVTYGYESQSQWTIQAAKTYWGGTATYSNFYGTIDQYKAVDFNFQLPSGDFLSGAGSGLSLKIMDAGPTNTPTTVMTSAIASTISKKVSTPSEKGYFVDLKNKMLETMNSLSNLKSKIPRPRLIGYLNALSRIDTNDVTQEKNSISSLLAGYRKKLLNDQLNPVDQLCSEAALIAETQNALRNSDINTVQDLMTTYGNYIQNDDNKRNMLFIELMVDERLGKYTEAMDALYKIKQFKPDARQRKKYIEPSYYILETILQEEAKEAGRPIDKKQIQQKLLPTQTAIMQNYPNPFNPTTNISYQLKENGSVSLKIYDMLGREVAVLVNGQKDAGYYSATFKGSRFSSGIYFARLTVQGKDAKPFVKTMKMLMMK